MPWLKTILDVERDFRTNKDIGMLGDRPASGTMARCSASFLHYIPAPRYRLPSQANSLGGPVLRIFKRSVAKLELSTVTLDHRFRPRITSLAP